MFKRRQKTREKPRYSCLLYDDDKHMNSKGSATLLQHLTTHAASITENVAAAANSTLRKIKKTNSSNQPIVSLPESSHHSRNIIITLPPRNCITVPDWVAVRSAAKLYRHLFTIPRYKLHCCKGNWQKKSRTCIDVTELLVNVGNCNSIAWVILLRSEFHEILYVKSMLGNIQYSVGNDNGKLLCINSALFAA